jgi:hypothetical protein
MAAELKGWALNQVNQNQACPHDGTPRPFSPRYPRALCAGCADKATDMTGRSIGMGNVSLSGGFQAYHTDDDTDCAQVNADGRVLIDGVTYIAGEAYMGGIVVQPEP